MSSNKIAGKRQLNGALEKYAFLLDEDFDPGAVETVSEDKEVAAQAVGFVVNNSEKGMIGLCTNIALLLKDIKRHEKKELLLEQENRDLKLQLKDYSELHSNPSIKCKKHKNKRPSIPAVLPSSATVDRSENSQEGDIPCLDPVNVIVTTAEIHAVDGQMVKTRYCDRGVQCNNLDQEECLIDDNTETIRELRDEVTKLRLEIRTLQTQLSDHQDGTGDHDTANDELSRICSDSVLSINPLIAPAPLLGCRCSQCVALVLKAGKSETGHIFRLSTNGCPFIETGDRILLPGDQLGTVKYVGHLDGTSVSGALYVGVQLDKPEGDCNGDWKGKRYFRCNSNYGIFVEPHQIVCKVDTQLEALLRVKEHRGSKPTRVRVIVPPWEECTSSA